MIRLDLKSEPEWIDLGHGVRVRCRRIDTALIARASNDPRVAELKEGSEPATVSVAMAKVLAELAILEWEGVGDGEGYPVAPSPENVGALLDLFPIFDAFQTRYVAKGLMLSAEGNDSAPLPNGTSAGAKDTAAAA